ncbi:SPOR domain-containing protein [Rhodobacter sp. NSM]|uniref:SPOR domain-containing protein n=1 Tax=Rhodobacter sp. NSM TaxID=3457501 RepID=UPI003FD6521F
MADVDFDDFGGYYAPQRPAKVQRMINIAGGVSSIALILGLAIWGYKLAVRDVNGIPVVRAIEGPMRIAPDNPGGEIAAHQGLAVNDVAAAGTASPPPDRLVLAPKPVELALEDGPGLEGAGATPEAVPAATPPNADADSLAMTTEELPGAAPFEDESQASALDEEELPAVDADATKLALAEAIAGTVEPEAVEEVEPMAEPIPPGALRRSPVPPPRPARATRAAGPAPVAAAAATVAATEVDAATLPAGTRLVQLGAFDDADSARREWDKLASRFGALISEKSRVVQTAQSGGRTFYRLRASGFADASEARRFCSALLAEDTACIPVAVR